MRVGRLVAWTIFLDEDGDLAEWNAYAIDMKQMMEPEPGCASTVSFLSIRSVRPILR